MLVNELTPRHLAARGRETHHPRIMVFDRGTLGHPRINAKIKTSKHQEQFKNIHVGHPTTKENGFAPPSHR
jgi:hypothetical protein